MSTSPYSKDLRKRVIDYIESGNSQVQAAKLFCLNGSTVNRWWLRYQKEGHYKPRVRPGAKVKIDAAALEEAVKSNPDVKAEDLAKLYKVNKWTICRWLKKLGFSYKKKRLPMWKQVKKSAKPTKKL